MGRGVPQDHKNKVSRHYAIFMINTTVEIQKLQIFKAPNKYCMSGELNTEKDNFSFCFCLKQVLGSERKGLNFKPKISFLCLNKSAIVFCFNVFFFKQSS